LVGTLDGDAGDFLFESLSDVVGEVDDLIEFVDGGCDVGSYIEGAGEMEVSLVVDFTVGANLGRLNLGGHVVSSLNLPRVAVGG
jgi:hypothetical protein